MEGYNIQELHGGDWITRYRSNMTYKEAQEKFEWLSTDVYWKTQASGYRLVFREFQVTVISERKTGPNKNPVR